MICYLATFQFNGTVVRCQYTIVTSQIEWDFFLTVFEANQIKRKQLISHCLGYGDNFSQINLA